MSAPSNPRQNLLAHLKDRLETIRKYPDRAREECLQPLDVSRLLEIKIQLSWGGPGDGFKLYLNDQGQVESGLYYWEDWGVYAQEWLQPEELHPVAQYFAPLLP